MSFSKTVSIFAALSSIFGASIAGFKLAQDNQSNTPQLEEKVQQLEKQLEEATTQKPVEQVAPAPQIIAPQPATLPPVTPPPPVPENVTP